MTRPKMIVAGTGHRPKDCEEESIVRTKARVALRYSGANVFITGCADGFDLWAADEALELGIEVWSARPWRNHSADDMELYTKVLAHSRKQIITTAVDEYTGPELYFERNRFMVDQATHLLAYLNPEKTKGGSFYTRNYAKDQGKPVKNIWNAPPF